jgi:3-hydroxyisobutyryl-CoA hydrolase
LTSKNGATPDFRTGVAHVLIDKKATSERPAWSPATVEEVSSDHIDKFFEQSEFTSSAPTLSISEDLKRSKETPPARFALPTEEEIAAAILGKHSSSGQTAITLSELLSKFEKLRPGKHGVKEKILEVVDRKCKGGDSEWLEWKH